MIVVCPSLSLYEKRELKKRKLGFYEDSLERLEGENGQVKKAILKNGMRLPCQALFFSCGQQLNSNVAQALGCRINSEEFICVDSQEQSSVPGVYVAGDASRDLHMVINAASEGARAAVAIHKALMHEDA